MIETRRLRLRRWHPADLPFVGAILGDPDVMEFSDTGTLTETGQVAWLKDAAATGKSEALPGMLAIERKRDDDIIGYISLSSNLRRVNKGEAEIGFRLARYAWEQGYATEAVNGIIEATAGNAVYKRIVAIVDPNNYRSTHVLRKAGMTYERDIMFEGYDYADHLYIRDPRL